MSTIKNIFWVLLFAGIGFSALMLYFEVSWWTPAVKIPKITNVLNLSNFSLINAPKESLRGRIISMSREVKWESRIATESAKIVSPVTVQQGESLSTGIDGHVVLSFENAAEIKISPDTDIAVVQTLPADLVFSQGKGEAEYKKLSQVPVSIRVLHLLIENGGDIIVALDPQRPIVAIKIIDGSATIAYNDVANNTQVKTFTKGASLIFNDDTRQAAAE